MQDFFEGRMTGIYRWGVDTQLRDAELAEKVPGVRQRAKGIAIVDFDGYALMLHVPDDEDLPLGKITLFHPDFGSFDGAVDMATWDRVEAKIKETHMKGLSNVSG